MLDTLTQTSPTFGTTLENVGPTCLTRFNWSLERMRKSHKIVKGMLNMMFATGVLQLLR